MEEKKVSTSNLPGYTPTGDKNTTSEPRNDVENIEELPGLKPKDIDRSDRWKWDKKYMNLSYEKKILFETQEQTRLIRRISNNVLFYFWLTIISLTLYLIVVVQIFDKL